MQHPHADLDMRQTVAQAAQPGRCCQLAVARASVTRVGHGQQLSTRQQNTGQRPAWRPHKSSTWPGLFPLQPRSLSCLPSTCPPVFAPPDTRQELCPHTPLLHLLNGTGPLRMGSKMWTWPPPRNAQHTRSPSRAQGHTAPPLFLRPCSPTSVQSELKTKGSFLSPLTMWG